MTTLKSLGIVGAVFIVVVAVAAALSLFLRGSPETPTTQAQTAAVEHTPAPDAPPTDAAVSQSRPRLRPRTRAGTLMPPIRLRAKPRRLASKLPRLSRLARTLAVQAATTPS